MTIPKKNVLEWTVFVASALLVLATVGYLAAAALRAKDTPPEVRIFAGPPAAHEGVHRVPLLIRNDGDATAESVHIEVLLLRGEEEVESAELDVAFVPRKSEREAWVTFRHDPRCCAIVTRAVGYEKP